jgi:hypothetical protein
MHSGSNGYRRFIAFLLASLLPLVAILAALHIHFKPSFESIRPPQADFSDFEAHGSLQQPYRPSLPLKKKVPTSAEKRILIGVSIDNVYELSVKDRVFMLEGVYWLKWPEVVNGIIRDLNLPTNKIIQFRNQVESDSMQIEAEQPNPRRLASGDYWQAFHFSGKFYIPDVQLKGFPFDVLTLPVIMELGPDTFSCSLENPDRCVGLVFDHASMAQVLGEYATMNGYETVGSRAYEYVHTHAKGVGTGKASSNAAVQVDMIYRTDPIVAFWSFLFPLFLLVSIAILSSSLPGSRGDMRLAIPTTVLLTLIFLQMGYQSDLPPLGYVTFLDWLYIYAYVVSASLFLLFVWGTNAHTQASALGNEEKAVRRINRVDTIFQVIAFLGLLAVIASGLAFQP